MFTEVSPFTVGVFLNRNKQAWKVEFYEILEPVSVCILITDAILMHQYWCFLNIFQYWCYFNTLFTLIRYQVYDLFLWLMLPKQQECRWNKATRTVSGSILFAIRPRTKSTTSWFERTSQMPSQARIRNSWSSVKSLTTTSGCAVTHRYKTCLANSKNILHMENNT